jgi:anti-sigma regulatory factor (Ser/Thr protein kinase)
MADDRLSLPLAAEPVSVTRGRHFVRDVLLGWGLPRLVDDAQLGTSELVANAVRHARTELVLSVGIRSGAVIISIQDGEPELRRPVPASSDALAEHGRGLHIVAAISSDWGVTTAAGGKIIWFSLPLPDTRTVDAHFYTLDDRRSDSRKAAVPGAQEEQGPLQEQAESAN